MTENEQKLAREILRYGEILSDRQYRTKSWKFIRDYVVYYSGVKYAITLINGEFIYLKELK